MSQLPSRTRQASFGEPLPTGWVLDVELPKSGHGQRPGACECCRGGLGRVGRSRASPGFFVCCVWDILDAGFWFARAAPIGARLTLPLRFALWGPRVPGALFVGAESVRSVRDGAWVAIGSCGLVVSPLVRRRPSRPSSPFDASSAVCALGYKRCAGSCVGYRFEGIASERKTLFRSVPAMRLEANPGAPPVFHERARRDSGPRDGAVPRDTENVGGMRGRSALYPHDTTRDANDGRARLRPVDTVGRAVRRRRRRGELPG